MKKMMLVFKERKNLKRVLICSLTKCVPENDFKKNICRKISVSLLLRVYCEFNVLFSTM